MKKYILILLLFSLCIVNFQAYAQSNLSLEYLREINISSSYFPVGRLPLPIICGNMLYENSVGAPYNNYHNIYDIGTGELLKSYKFLPSIDSLGLYTNGKQVVYVHEKDKKVIVYEGLEKVWEKEFDDYIYGLTMDEDYIYVAVAETGIVILDMDGKLHNIINGEIGEYISEKEFAIDMLNDGKYLFLFDREYLFKINKDTYEIEYKIHFKNSYYKVLQNDKYLFTSDINMIDKETGEVVDRIAGGDFAVDEELIIYTDDKLTAKSIATGKIIWEKEIKENQTFAPLIDNGFLYIFLEKFYVIDVKTGDVVWEDEPIDDFLEYVPQILATDEYVTVFIENRDNPKLRIYRKIFE